MFNDVRLFAFDSKGLKTDKLPAQVFEIDEDAKDEVSRAAFDHCRRAFQTHSCADLIDRVQILSLDCCFAEALDALSSGE